MSRIYLASPAPTGETAFREGWNHALPIGNGSIGAMVYGDPRHDILQLNEDTVWYGGGGRNRVNPKALESWKKCRELLAEGRISEAEALCQSDLYAVPDQQRYYDTCGHVTLDFQHGEYKNYRRELDISEAVCRVSFDENGAGFEREYFVSYPEQVIVMRQISTSGKRFGCRLDISDRDNPEYCCDINDIGSFVTVKQPEGGCEYCVMTAADSDGCVIFSEKGFEVYDAT